MSTNALAAPPKRKTHHKKQVDIVQPQVLQALVQPRLDARVVRRPHLGHHKQVLALDDAGAERLLDALPDLVLVTVAVGAVDEAVPRLDGVGDRGLDLARGGLPCPWVVVSVWAEAREGLERCTEAKGGDGQAVVKGVSLVCHFGGGGADCGVWAGEGERLGE